MIRFSNMCNLELGISRNYLHIEGHIYSYKQYMHSCIAIEIHLGDNLFSRARHLFISCFADVHSLQVWDQLGHHVSPLCHSVRQYQQEGPVQKGWGTLAAAMIRFPFLHFTLCNFGGMTWSDCNWLVRCFLSFFRRYHSLPSGGRTLWWLLQSEAGLPEASWGAEEVQYHHREIW